MLVVRSPAAQVGCLEMEAEYEWIVQAALLEQSLRIVEFAREHGCVTIFDRH